MAYLIIGEKNTIGTSYTEDFEYLKECLVGKNAIRITNEAYDIFCEKRVKGIWRFIGKIEDVKDKVIEEKELETYFSFQELYFIKPY